jgi:poly(hydroxyalkanoate) granule-associated protein
MARKTPPHDTPAPGPLPLGAIKDSAQHIWLAGLGAFAKAQEESGKVFDALVKDGMDIQRKTQTAAHERLTGVGERLGHAASDLSSRAVGQWDRLETIFEDRVAKALQRLGVPAARDIEALNARIDALTALLQQGAPTPSAAPPRKTTRRGAGSAPAAQAPAAPSPRKGRRAP